MILFAGYHEAEQRMIRSVLSGLEKSHIRCEHFKESVISSNLSENEEPLILPLFESFIPGTRSSYGEKIALTSPHILKDVERKLLNLSPSLVVWSPGSEYGLILRERARANGIETLCFLPPYFEFKFIEPLRIPHIYPDEIFIVSGVAGRTRLRQVGVRNDVIIEVGCPFLDDFFARTLVPVENSIDILFTLQNTYQDLQLYEKLREYSQIRQHSILNIRQHPLAISEEINPSKTIEDSFLKFSKNVALETDIENAWVVVSNTSFTLFEGTALGRPMVSWNGSCLPRNIYRHEAYAFHYVETTTELFHALDLIYEKRNEITPEQIRSMATGVLSKTVSGSQFAGRATDEVVSIMHQRSKMNILNAV